MKGLEIFPSFRVLAISIHWAVIRTRSFDGFGGYDAHRDGTQCRSEVAQFVGGCSSFELQLEFAGAKK